MGGTQWMCGNIKRENVDLDRRFVKDFHMWMVKFKQGKLNFLLIKSQEIEWT